MDSRPIPNLQPLTEFYTLNFQREDALSKAIRNTIKTAMKEDGLFLVRSTRPGTQPVEVFHACGNLGIAGRWHLGRIRQAKGLGTYEVVIYRPYQRNPSVMRTLATSIEALAKIMRDLSERGSQSFLSQYNIRWYESQDNEFLNRGYPK